MSSLLTSADLVEWSERLDSQGHLPTLIRRLIMGTVRPDRVRVPSGESVALPGLDGEVRVSGGSKPFVPAGSSVWEFGTNYARKKKATEDYEKRTRQTTPAMRNSTTFVFVTSRRWTKGTEWIAEMEKRGDGWKAIVVLTADELVTWLEMCPAASAWLREHLGRGSMGDVALDDWFSNWAAESNPATPAGALVAGRRDDVVRILDALDEPPRTIDVAANSLDEAVAFVAASLTLGPGPDPKLADAETPETDEERIPDTRERSADELEAFRSRAVVIEDVDGWRRWSSHSVEQILVPLFVPDSIDAAIGAGHHVVLSRVARGARESGRLTPLDPYSAAKAWEAAGLDFYRAHEVAKACRRSFTSLRRRLSRHAGELPEWAMGDQAALLAAALLAGGWNAEREGDREVLIELTGLSPWKMLSRALVPFTVGQDAPLGVLDERWDFTDVLDAWDALAPFVTVDDLNSFEGHVRTVLPEPDPDVDVSGAELMKRAMDRDRPRRRHSSRLRTGMATTLAVLGAVVGDDIAAGSKTGRAVASLAVHDLLHEADGNKWLALVDVLGLLAEAAPEAFLEAVENALSKDAPPVMRLFEEKANMLGEMWSQHSPLLWALETLAFSPALVARVAVVLGRLAALDPGGRLGDRPAEALRAVLHIHAPQGAVTAANRTQVLDAVTSAVPAVATTLPVALIEGDTFGVIRSGPRFRDWPMPRAHASWAEVVAAVDELTSRVIENQNTDWSIAVDLITQVSAERRDRLIATLGERWDGIGEGTQQEILRKVRDIVERNRRYREAQWALPDEALAKLEAFLGGHGAQPPDVAAEALFSFGADWDIGEDIGADELKTRRVAVVTGLAAKGVHALVEFARTTDIPGLVGAVLAEVTTDLDDELVDLLANDPTSDPVPHAFAGGLVSVRTETNDTWLRGRVEKRPDLTARLLLPPKLTTEVLDLIDAADPEQQVVFWTDLHPYRATSEMVERVCIGLLAVNRPFAAIAAANTRDEPGAPPELILFVLQAPMTGETEDASQVDQSIQYQVGRLIDRLEASGQPDVDLAQLEFFYQPLLHFHRKPRAYYRELARDPALFAEMVASIYRPDRRAAADDDQTSEQDGTGTSEEEASEVLAPEQVRRGEANFRILNGWISPLPGGTSDEPSTSEGLQAWVDAARTELANRQRAKIASQVIGQAIASTSTDADGTWPSEPVRDLLDHENDPDLERALVIARRNQRGFTTRGVYSGGGQERDLAKKFREWNERVRDRWPRAGLVLETLAQSYDSEARQADQRAERDARD